MRYDRVKPKRRSAHGSILSAYNRDARYARAWNTDREHYQCGGA